MSLNSDDQNIDASKVDEEPLETEKVVEPEKSKTVEELNRKADDDIVAKLVEERLADALKDVKKNLDKAYQMRDELKARVTEFEKKEKEATIQRMREEGKHKEIYEMQLKERDDAIENLRKQNIELTRDLTINDVLKTLPFRSENASKMAFREIVQQIVQDESGNWVHRSGVSIKDFVTVFAKDDEFAFLFKSKANTGNGTTVSATGTVSTSSSKSLFDLSQKEVLKLAAEGKLPRRKL
jgi:hypothetical protein